MEKVNFDYNTIRKDYYRDVIKANNARSRWHIEKFNTAKDSANDKATGVLDIGCGPGVFLEYFDNDITLIGYDIAEEQLEAGRRALPYAEFTSQKSGLKEFADDVSHIYSIELIEHISHKEFEEIMDLISEIIIVRQSKGKQTSVVITTPNYSSLWPLIEVFVDVVTKLNYRAQHISKYKPRTLDRVINNALDRNGVKAAKVDVSTFMGFGWISPYLIFLDKFLIGLLNRGHLICAKIDA